MLRIQIIQFVKSWERFKPNVYLDQAGKATIGYGHLILPGEKFTTIAEDEAVRIFINDLYKIQNGVNLAFGNKINLLPHQFDAVLSLTFNIGLGAFRDSTLLRLLRAGQIDEAGNQFNRWIYVTQNGVKVVSNGLKRRREAETIMYKEGRYINNV